MSIDWLMAITAPVSPPIPPKKPPGLLPQAQPLGADGPTFGFSGGALASIANGVANTVYATDGARYALEQTLCFTAPRTLQQFTRTKQVTGENNAQAAKETFINDLAADFEDTFLPGILATLVIGRSIDNHHAKGTFVRYNMGLDHLNFYQSLAQGTQTPQEFFQKLETSLNEAHLNRPATTAPLNLQQTVETLGHHEASKDKAYYWQATQKMFSGGLPEPRHEAVDKIAAHLGLRQQEVTLQHGGHTLTTSLEDLLKDLSHVAQHNVWGESLATNLQKTAHLKGYQAIGTLTAVAASLTTPWLIREITRRDTGCDDFPGTRPVEKYFRKVYGLPDDYPNNRKDANGNPVPCENETPGGKLKAFPYLQSAWKAGNKAPALFSAAFMGVVGGVMANDLFDFKAMKPRFKNPAQLLETYAFERAFPWTPVKQMAITYGALCGLRVMNARNDNEFRERSVKDAVLGWYTLTYFFPKCRDLLATSLEKGIHKTLVDESLLNADQIKQAQHLLMKDDGAGKLAIRDKRELSPTFVKNILGVADDTAKAVSRQLEGTHNIATVATGALSVFLIGYLEPQIGIWLTNKLERGKWEKLARQYHAEQHAEHLKHPDKPDNKADRHTTPTHTAALGPVTAVTPSPLINHSPFAFPSVPSRVAVTLPAPVRPPVLQPAPMGLSPFQLSVSGQPLPTAQSV